LIGAVLVGLMALAAILAANGRSETANYYKRMVLYYASILLTGVLGTFGSLPTYFLNLGAIVVFACMRWICSSWMDLTIEVRGAEKLKDNLPQVLVSNHQSAIDALVMSHVNPSKCAVMAKASLKWVPFFNVAALLSNTVFVNRSNHESAQRSAEQAAEAIMRKRLKLWVFAEGTRHRGHGMLPFKKGAFNIAVHAQVPVVPVVISDYAPFYATSPSKYFHPQGRIICEVMEPVPTQGLGRDDVPALCERIRDQMLEVYDRISHEAREMYERQGSGAGISNGDVAASKEE